MTQRLYALSIEATGLYARARINDRTVVERAAFAPLRLATGVNQYVLSGHNRLRVEAGLTFGDLRATAVTTAPPAAENGVLAPPQVLTIALRQGVRGVVPGPEDVIAAWSLATPIPLPRRDALVTVLQTEFEASVDWECSWVRAVPRAEDAAVSELFRAYVRAVTERDSASLLRLRQKQLEDTAMAYSLDFERVRAGFEATLSEAISAASWTVREETLSEVTFRVEGDGRVLRATGARGASPVIAMSEKGQVPFEFCCAFVNGEWRIVE